MSDSHWYYTTIPDVVLLGYGLVTVGLPIYRSSIAHGLPWKSYRISRLFTHSESGDKPWSEPEQTMQESMQSEPHNLHLSSLPGVALPPLHRALCQVILGNTSAAEWSQLQARDWSILVAVAAREGILALLYQRFQASVWPIEMPSEVRQLLLRAYRQNVAASLLLYKELPKIIDVISTIVQPVILKGAALGPQLYEQPVLRPITDIDLLIPEKCSTASDKSTPGRRL